jgi:hypothetical protein
MSLPPMDPTVEAKHIVAMHEEVIKAVLAKLEAGDTRMDQMEAKVDKVAEDTGLLLEILDALKGGFKVIGWLGTFAKWVGGIIGAIVAVWGFVRAIKGG